MRRLHTLSKVRRSSKSLFYDEVSGPSVPVALVEVGRRGPGCDCKLRGEGGGGVGCVRSDEVSALSEV